MNEKLWVDEASTSIVRGWAVWTDTPQTVQVWSGGKRIDRAVTWSDRPDVVETYPFSILRCGFMAHIELPQLDFLAEIEIRISPAGLSQKLQVPSIQYCRFLSSVWGHFNFVRRTFPLVNATSISDKDRHQRPNSPEEMMSIADHLYKLDRLGVTGEFAEFGCFKGYSSSMLSYVCELIGLRMHIFDSFEGLPKSESNQYTAGEFAGSRVEVTENIKQFGCPDCVVLHKGYFCDSLRTMKMPKLISLWMDVDLETSAKDVMTTFGSVDERGAVFSHECSPEHFADGISGPRGPDSVVPPIIDAYEIAGAQIAGRFIRGNTGAFWRDRTGIPVVENIIPLGLVEDGFVRV